MDTQTTRQNLGRGLNIVAGQTSLVRKELASDDFGLFALYYFQNYVKYALADFHLETIQDFRDLASGAIKELLLVMFRESGKTTYTKIFLIWVICTNRKRYINVDSYDKENAERMLFDVVYELSNNKKLKEDFGVLFSRKRDQEDVKQTRVSNFVTENGIRVEAHSTQESIRGRIHLEQRPDCLVLDDFETNVTKNSPVKTKSIQEHITEALGGMDGNGIIIYLGNYLTEYGNVQYLIDRSKIDKNLRVRNVPVIINDMPAWGAKYTMTDEEAEQFKIGNPGRPPKISIESKIRQLGSQVFTYEMMNQPIDDSIAEFKKEWYQHKEPHEIMGIRTNVFITIDSAVKELEKSDFTGISIVYVDEENRWYVKTERHKVNSKALLDKIFELYRLYKPTMIGLEETTFTMALEPYIQEKMRQENLFFTVTPLKTGGVNKEARIRGLIPRFENKQVWLVGGNEHLKDEMRAFPRGQHDDVLDSLAHAQSIVYKPEKINRAQEVLNERNWGLDERTGYLN